MVENAQWLVFQLDAGRYALPLRVVERIVRAVEITPLPRAPGIVLGAIDVAGEILPVFDVRRRFGLPERPLDPADQFLIARTTRRTVVLVIDGSQGVMEAPPSAVTDSAKIELELEHIRGVIALPDGLVLIHDLELFLSPEETRALERALSCEEGLDAR